jgi:hypothetical protein
MEGTAKEKRLFERFRARFPAKYEHSRDDFGTNVFLRDASSLGAKISSRERLYINDNVSLLVQLPDGVDPLRLSGRVVWAKENTPQLWDIGVQFYKTDFMKIRRMFKFVQIPSFIN